MNAWKCGLVISTGWLWVGSSCAGQPAKGRQYFAHQTVEDCHGVIAPWYGGQNGQCDFRVRIAAETLKRYTDATAVSLSYGPYGGGHGHPDKLSIALYAQGRQWIPHYGSMPYETSWKTQWTSHTVSHNTLVVDGTSQNPAGRQDRMWPVDTQQGRVIGQVDRFDAEGRSVSATCDTAYPGLILSRQLRLWEHCVVDRFKVSPSSKGSAAQARQFDYVLHVDGDFVESSPRLPANSSSLGKQCGYQHLRQRASARAEKIARLVFESGPRRLRIWVVPQDGPAEVILAEGPTNSPTERKPVLILRQRGPTAHFLTLLEPIDPQNPVDIGELTRPHF